jgi:hypothetical protein
MIGKSVKFDSVGAFAGARITSLYVPSKRLKKAFRNFNRGYDWIQTYYDDFMISELINE